MKIPRHVASTLRRSSPARAGLIALAVALALGTGFGAALGAGARHRVEASARTEIAQALETADELRRALDEHDRALKLIAQMPSVVTRRGAESRAFAALRRLYPAFETIRVEGGPVRAPAIEPGGGRLRLVASIANGSRVVGVLGSGWPERLVARRGRFGTNDADVSTVVVSRSGVPSAEGADPPSFDRLAALHTGSFETMAWNDGTPYLTSIRRLPSHGPDGHSLAVVGGVPQARIGALTSRIRRVCMGFGLTLGSLVGGLMWFAIARSTRRLLRRNADLERRVTERTTELAFAERAFRTLFENAPFGLYQSDPEGRFVRINPALARLLGYDTPEAAISGLGAMQALGERADRDRFLTAVRAGGEATATFSLPLPGGRVLWVEETARLVRDEAGAVEAIEGAVHDVTTRHENEVQLRRIGETDPLTGLLNRRGLEEAIGEAESPVSFVALDLDDFKGYNDAYGHPSGDHALRTVAEALRSAVRASDVVARLGGEEFVLVLPHTTAEGARRVAETLRLAVEACEGLEAPLTVSGGVATAHRPKDLDEAFAAADRALYQAKATGKNRIVVNPASLA